MKIFDIFSLTLKRQLLLVWFVLFPSLLFGGWSQEITGGPQGDDIPATGESPKLYNIGSEALPFDNTELPVMYPDDRLWFDVRDKDRVMHEYIREVVNNRYIYGHQWEKAPDYFASEPAPGKLNKDYLKALHARMAFFSKLLQMPYTVASDESHAQANTSIIGFAAWFLHARRRRIGFGKVIVPRQSIVMVSVPAEFR